MLQKCPQERHFKGGKRTLPLAVAKRMEHNHKTNGTQPQSEWNTTTKRMEHNHKTNGTQPQKEGQRNHFTPT